MRNQGMWNIVYSLFWGTFNEAMKIIGPAYEDALNRIRERLQGTKLNVENQMVWSFMEQLRSGRHTQYAMTDERAADARFHARLEVKLQAFRGLK